jgi:excisionase family DNA binding protein
VADDAAPKGAGLATGDTRESAVGSRDPEKGRDIHGSAPVMARSCVATVAPIPVSLSVADAAELMGECNATIYTLLQAGELRSFPIGRRRRVIGASIAALIRRREQVKYAPTCASPRLNPADREVNAAAPAQAGREGEPNGMAGPHGSRIGAPRRVSQQPRPPADPSDDASSRRRSRP